VAAGLLVIGVSRAREAAARSSCQNNLRLIGISPHGYHKVDKVFPAGTVAGTDLPPERRLNWLFELDPWIHARMDPNWNKAIDRPWDAEENLRLARNNMFWFHCPGHRGERERDGLCLTHYVGIAGVGEDAALLREGNLQIGAFGYDRVISLADIEDCLLVTLVATETTVRNGPWISGGPASVRGLDVNGGPYIGAGGQFGGTHRGGAQGLFADASVRFLGESIQPKVFEALATIAGGDETGGFARE
jgi:hypothetical protein